MKIKLDSRLTRIILFIILVISSIYFSGVFWSDKSFVLVLLNIVLLLVSIKKNKIKWFLSVIGINLIYLVLFFGLPSDKCGVLKDGKMIYCDCTGVVKVFNSEVKCIGRKNKCYYYDDLTNKSWSTGTARSDCEFEVK